MNSNSQTVRDVSRQKVGNGKLLQFSRMPRIRARMARRVLRVEMPPIENMLKGRLIQEVLW